jgi:DNA-directed RNA polymerase specialized sigma24 family protein
VLIGESKMTNFDPYFWEIPVDFNKLTEFDNSRSVCYETDDERESRWIREHEQKKLMTEVMDIISCELTPKQQQVIILYFFGQKTQEEIGKIMGVPHQVVSQHIYGIMRNGKKVGGAIARIRKACRKRGIHKLINAEIGNK